MKVLKFGGTSLGYTSNIRRVAELISGNERKIVVFSAMSGTTDLLVAASNHIKEKNFDKASLVFNEISDKFISTADELFSIKDNFFKFLFFLEKNLFVIDNLINKPFTLKVKNQILSLGEIITVELIKIYLKEIKSKVIEIPALEIIKLTDQENPDFELIEKNLRSFLDKHSSENLFITQGFICRNCFNEIDNLKRGGSDFTATILGSVCNAEEIQIWSDIDGMHNNDPRYVAYTNSIRQLSYEEAEELAYFGAKVLHPTCIYPAKIKKIPILLKNTMNPEANGTIIYEFSKSCGIKAIAAKDGIAALKVHSGRMLNAYGFLKKIFEIFEFYKTPVDMITTSELSVSMTIDNTEFLTNIVCELNKLGTVEVFHEQSIICVVGNFKSEEKGIVAEVLKSIRHIPLRMLSYGASENNLTLLVHKNYKKEVLRSLHINHFSKNEIKMS